MINCYLTSTKQ